MWLVKVMFPNLYVLVCVFLPIVVATMTKSVIIDWIRPCVISHLDAVLLLSCAFPSAHVGSVFSMEKSTGNWR